MKGVTGTVDVQMEFTKVHELVYELRIEQVMTRRVQTLAPNCTMGDAKELFRVNRISGAPVLEGGRLVGIVSMEDIILTLERGEMDLRVGEKMTTVVESIRADDTVVRAINRFAQRRFGRLPVVDQEGNVVGIVTRSDIVRGLLRAIDLDHTHEENAHHRASHVFDDLTSDRTSVTLRYAVPPHDLSRGGAASSQIKKALTRLGTDPRATRRAAIACYEAETNIIIHSVDGGQIIAEVQPHQVVIQAIDSGPGIADLDQAMQAGFSTALDWVRELGFGAGMGLNNIKACADHMHVDTGPGRGTHMYVLVGLEAKR